MFHTFLTVLDSLEQYVVDITQSPVTLICYILTLQCAWSFDVFVNVAQLSDQSRFLPGVILCGFVMGVHRQWPPLSCYPVWVCDGSSNKDLYKHCNALCDQPVFCCQTLHMQ